MYPRLRLFVCLSATAFDDVQRHMADPLLPTYTPCLWPLPICFASFAPSPPTLAYTRTLSPLPPSLRLALTQEVRLSPGGPVLHVVLCSFSARIANLSGTGGSGFFSDQLPPRVSLNNELANCSKSLLCILLDSSFLSMTSVQINAEACIKKQRKLP